jgi:hypothetical protein
LNERVSRLDVSDAWVRRTFGLLGDESLSSDQMEAAVLAMAGDAMVATRLIDWVPEATGLLLIRHIANVHLPSDFSAKRADGQWVRIPMNREPIVGRAIDMASIMFHSDERPLVIRVASRGAMMDAVNRALHGGSSLRELDGTNLSGPTLIGIPAEVYLPPAEPSFLSRLFRRGSA